MGSWFKPTSEHVEPAWVPKDDTRSTVELIETCVITLVLCAWTAIHLDIPCPEGRKSKWHSLFTRLQWTVLGILAPEYILWIAFAEFWEARSICREVKLVDSKRDDIESHENRNVTEKEEGEKTGDSISNRESFSKCDPQHKPCFVQIEASSTPSSETESIPSDTSKIENEGIQRQNNTKTIDFAQNNSSVHTKAKAEHPSPPSTPKAPWWRRIKTWNDDVRLTLGFYIEMGGYEIVPTEEDGTEIPVENVPKEFKEYVGRVTSRGAILLYKHKYLPKFEHERINDQSKMDILAKAITCVQASWMIVQCIGRKVQGLPITLLEVNTVMHVMCALFVFLLWLRKPQDVRYPTRIYATTKKLEEFRAIVEESQVLKRLAKEGKGKKESIWTLLNKLLQNRTYCRPETIKLTEATISESSSKAVELGSCRTSRYHEAVGIGAVIGLLTSSIYGAVHLTQWFDHFPTRLERAMWRISGCIIVGMPFFLALFLALIYTIRYLVSERKVGSGKWKYKNGTWIYDHPGFDPKCKVSSFKAQYQPHTYFLEDMRKNNRWGIYSTYSILILLQVIASLSYISARTFLVVEAFASLRSLPEGSYTTINWLALIPHF